MGPVATDVCVVGGGVAGLTAALFTQRNGLDTVVVNDHESILRRNAHLENVPGFPAGVNSRTFLDLLQDQADRNGVERADGKVTDVVADAAEPLTLTQADGTERSASFVVCASWADTTYLEDLAGLTLVDRGSKTYVEVDERGYTGVAGIYAAGRVAGTHHQTVVAAGDGASVGLSVIEDSAVPFYHDWVVPEGYFTDRDREVPPGCEEIDAAERRGRETASLAALQEAFAEQHPEEPTPHPSLE